MPKIITDAIADSNLFVLTGQEEKETPYGWDNMPSFNQQEKKEYHLLKVRFRNEDDLKAFAKLLDQNISTKTKAIWYPVLDRFEDSLFRWVDEEETDE